MSRTTGGAGRQYVQRSNQTRGVSRSIPRRPHLWLSRSAACAAFAALGRARLGAWPALDRQGVGDRLQLASADGEFGGPIPFVLAARRYRTLRAGSQDLRRKLPIRTIRVRHQKTSYDFTTGDGRCSGGGRSSVAVSHDLETCRTLQRRQRSSSQSSDPGTGGRLPYAGISREFFADGFGNLSGERAGAAPFRAAQDGAAGIQNEYDPGAGLDGLGNSRIAH